METSSAIAGAAAGESGSESAYRPHLDGLRAVAVYLVVLFHAGSGWFSGGYIGVDVFFVLSGFLVTQLLLRDIARGRLDPVRPLLLAAVPPPAPGRVRRADRHRGRCTPRSRRPAEVADVGRVVQGRVPVLDELVLHPPVDRLLRRRHHDQSRAALLVARGRGAVLPAVAVGVGRRCSSLTRRMDRARRHAGDPHRRRGRRARLGRVGALAARHSIPTAPYYGTDTRAYELLAGALLALAPATRSTTAARIRRVTCAPRPSSSVDRARRASRSSWVHLDAIERGVAVTIATVRADRRARSRRRRHREARAVEPRRSSTSARSPTAPTSGTGSSSSSLLRTFHVEHARHHRHRVPRRDRARVAQLRDPRTSRCAPSQLLDRHRCTVIASGLAISIVSALVLIPAIVDPGHATTPTAARLHHRRLHARARRTSTGRTRPRAAGPFVNCLHKPVSKCTVVHGTGPNILLIGDSHAWMLIPAFTEIARAGPPDPVDLGSGRLPVATQPVRVARSR